MYEFVSIVSTAFRSDLPEGAQLKKTGEVRPPREGEWFLQTSYTGAALALTDFKDEPKEILEVVYDLS